MARSGTPPMAISPLALAAVLAGTMPLAPEAARAQAVSPNQPLAIQQRPGLPPPPCRLVVPRREQVLQPVRIAPAQVPGKNRMGCLSAADAIYGADGCPSQLCGRERGTRVPLP